MELKAYKDDIDAGKFPHFEVDDELGSWQPLDQIWLKPPASGYLHVLVSASSGE